MSVIVIAFLKETFLLMIKSKHRHRDFYIQKNLNSVVIYNINKHM